MVAIRIIRSAVENERKFAKNCQEDKYFAITLPVHQIEASYAATSRCVVQGAARDLDGLRVAPLATGKLGSRGLDHQRDLEHTFFSDRFSENLQ